MFLAAFLFHFYLVAKYAVDIPFWDDWSHLPVHSNFSWVFAFHNEHRVPVTRLLVLILYHLNGWNIAQHQILNFIIYGGVVMLTVFAIANWVPGWKKWMSAAFCIVLFSPVAAENHQWATQTNWHVYLLFTLCSTILLFRERQTSLSLIAGSFMAIGLVYSIVSGVISAVVLLIVWTWFHFTRTPVPQRSSRALAGQWCLVGVPIILSIMLYFQGYEHPASHKAPAAPWTLAFWNYYGTIIDSGFAGPQKISEAFPCLGILAVFALCILPLILAGRVVRKRTFTFPLGYWRLFSVTSAFLAGIALIAFGRGNFPSSSAFSGRYAELSVFLMPLGAASWYWALQSRPTLRRKTMFFLLVVFLAAHGRLYWRFESYRINHEQRTHQLELIAQYYAAPTQEPYYLPDFWVQMNSYFEEAQTLNVSFYRKLMESQPKNP